MQVIKIRAYTFADKIRHIDSNTLWSDDVWVMDSDGTSGFVERSVIARLLFEDKE